ncbi:unnamed protein product [Rotaria socialis]|uniref:SAP domain-containing protein n=2 Tax=Rotaria socialis TaxID=392032 RepID=A0A820FEI8_9BILA|nr:unnamed protein product [Rotaria socialis]CAF4263327.1 unnamed protein product [Rotaria socialis]
MAEAQLTNQLTRIDSMTNVELRAELKRRGCPTSGNKKDLVAKLRVALQKEYEQAGISSPIKNQANFDGRNDNLSGLQQSPVGRISGNRPSLDTSTTSSNTYMTPHSGSPIVYSEHVHSGEVPLTYTNLQIHDQTSGQYPSVYNLKMQQNIHQAPAPMIPVPQQLTISSAERSQMYDQSILHNEQREQEISYMQTRQKRTSADNSIDTSMSSSTIPQTTPERRTRTRSKKVSVDSQQIEIPQQLPPMENIPTEVLRVENVPIEVSPMETVPIEVPPMETIPIEVPRVANVPIEVPRVANVPIEVPPMEIIPTEVIHPTPIQPTINYEQVVNNTSSTNDNVGNNIEVNPIVSKNSEEENKDRENIREEREDSRSPSVGSSSAKSESVIKEIPLSGERHRLSRSKSPKSRWHHSPSPQEQMHQPATIEEEPNSVITPTNDDNNTTNEHDEKSSIAVPTITEETNNFSANEKNQDNQDTQTKDESSAFGNQQPETAAPQQQLKPSRSQTSTLSSSSSSLMKGLNRSTINNRVNLSSDVLKTLIPNISLAPESIINDELEASMNEQDHGDDIEHSPNQSVLETSVATGFRLSDSMTIGELADQKQQRNRTVVIDVAVDSSSLNDDLIGNNVDSRKKTQTPAPPMRIASFESKTLLDGKTNALMIDEPVRVKDATATLEPLSRILYIRGLTRPFTLPLLKELLSRYGKLVDGEFWLDKIKSQCFVIYNTLEEAQNAREGLDGCRWPSTNPKTLSVRFGRQDEFEFSKTHDLPPDQMSIDAMDITNSRLVQEKPTSINKNSGSARRSASPIDETKANKKLRTTGNTDMREWDLPKFQEDKEKSPKERNVIEEPKVTVNEPPAKGLDDYFRKTKAKPPIYWLPLTEEQIVERALQQQQRNAARDEEQKKRELEESARTSNNSKDSKPRTNNNDNKSSNRTYRRSPSPREKRRRVSLSPSSRPRDNKRH